MRDLAKIRKRHTTSAIFGSPIPNIPQETHSYLLSGPSLSQRERVLAKTLKPQPRTQPVINGSLVASGNRSALWCDWSLGFARADDAASSHFLSFSACAPSDRQPVWAYGSSAMGTKSSSPRLPRLGKLYLLGGVAFLWMV